MKTDECVMLLDAIKDLDTSLFEIHKKLNDKPEHAHRSTEINELASALAKAQREMSIANMSRTNPWWQSKFADIVDIVEASREALTANGLSVVQNIISKDDGQNMLYTMLLHTSGQWIESKIRIVPPKNEIQTIMSHTAALKRMAYASLVGVAIGGEDDDGEISMHDSRGEMVKGTSPSMKYNPKEQSPDVITPEQREDLEYELSGYPDICAEVLDRLKLQSLADMPKNQFAVSIRRVRQIKGLREGIIKKEIV